MARLREKYTNTIKPAVMKELGLENPMQAPKITKIVLNMGVGEGATDKKVVENAVNDMRAIAGQEPIVTRARKSIAAFKIREEMPVGCKVTLRGRRMYEFMDRLVNVALPRVRDFTGISAKSFDGRGNYSLGIKEQIIFPEVEFDKTDKVRGLDITICTTAQNNEQALALLKAFDMPFKGGKK